MAYNPAAYQSNPKPPRNVLTKKDYKSIYIELDSGEIVKAAPTKSVSFQVEQSVTKPTPSNPNPGQSLQQAANQAMNNPSNSSQQTGKGGPQPPPPGISIRTAINGYNNAVTGGMISNSSLGTISDGTLIPTSQALQQLAKVLGVEFDFGLDDDPAQRYIGPLLPFKEPIFDSVFKARLMSVMTDNKYDRRIKGRKRGKLDMTRLYKIPTGSERVFTKKQERKGKEYNVVLCIDSSGSMRTDTTGLETAAECAVFLLKHFEGLNLNLGIVTYANNAAVVKKLSNDKTKDYKKVGSKLIATYVGGGTDTYRGLVESYKLFDKTRQHGRNLVLLLTDGEMDVPKAKHVAEQQEPAIATIGIGIGYNSGMSKNIKIDNVDQLKPQLLKVLKAEITRG